ncbi:family 43 glycosylhydrolase [Planctomyces sp. SH-PL62]|uniref:family 43 glycosylhydrolase n=1 Tax=Planctomyces sp. SH-PL62 TaxID=1636152 RepID=UPI00078E4338|nr:family 43 glycosylhydrolase [Planctomyces sp. SH-PL62]AMV40825.1 Extracellular exo-alpha-(1->5)-L-arabinofuranosidase precursor [Planctomyces sp. SH-PL62]
MKTWRRGLFGAMVVLAAFGEVRAQEVRDFFNMVVPSGADPWVYRHDDGWYYVTYTTGSDVVLRRSRTISGLGGAESRVVWTPTPGAPFSRELWAPEVHHLRGRWYVYVAADDGDNANHRMYVLENTAADPFEGAFLLKGKIADPASDRWAIDGSVLRLGSGDSERLYFVWSGWEGDVNVDQRLYIAPMSDPTTISGPRVELSRPTFPWEKAAGPPTINEGPQAIVRDGRMFLIYSAAGSWSDSYCLGMLSAKADADPLDPASWTKTPEPVFAGGDGVVAPGHCSFTKSPDGTEDWIVYHAAKKPGSGWSRSVRAQPFRWNDDGFPVFGAPIPPDAPIPVPAGEPARLRLEAEKARLEGGAKAVAAEGSSGGSKVVGLAGAEARLVFDVAVEKAGVYVAAVRYRTTVAANVRVAQRVLIDGRRAGTIAYPDSGGGRWSAAFVRLPLAAGANRVSLAPLEPEAEVDCLDVILDPLDPGPADAPTTPKGRGAS